MKKYFRDFYGCTASMELLADGQVKLRISDVYGNRVHNKTHKSENAARASMNRQSDGWKQVK